MFNEEYDIIVVGAGHAGSEAAAAAANMGSKTLLITMNLQNIAQMSCNPAMGGIAKGQIIKEIREAFIITAKDIEKIKKASRKIFPIKFSDVHPLTKNLNITKEKIKLMEMFWISSGFKASKEKLLSLLS